MTSSTQLISPRRLVLFLDGTWNSPSDHTNVFKLHQAASGYNENLHKKTRYKRFLNARWKIADPITEENWQQSRALYQQAEQIKYYHSGVGTGLLKVFGGATGLGLSSNLTKAYAFLCEHYRNSDQIYIFGFSRGSYTARSLTGLLDFLGVINFNFVNNSYRLNPAEKDQPPARWDVHAEISRQSKRLIEIYKAYTAFFNYYNDRDCSAVKRYRMMRKYLKVTIKRLQELEASSLELTKATTGQQDGQDESKGFTLLDVLQQFFEILDSNSGRAMFLSQKPLSKDIVRVLRKWGRLRGQCLLRSANPVKVRFLGVFDTVGALGLPRSLRTTFLLKLFGFVDYHKFHNTRLSSIVEHAFHALAIDEQRNDFVPTLFEPPRAKQGQYQIRYLVQAWFVGAHSNVGGGYEDNFLSDIPGRWMQDWASELGLKFDHPVKVTEHHRFEPVVNSATGLLAINKAPRAVLNTLRFEDKAVTFIHQSVQDHLDANVAYQPSNIEAQWFTSQQNIDANKTLGKWPK